MRFFAILNPVTPVLILLCSSTIAFATPAANPIGVPSEHPTDTPSWMPTAEPTVVVTPICGDGSIDAPEECDDGNTFSGDDCDATCKKEPCGVHPPAEFDDARTQIADEWIGTFADVTGPEYWFRTAEGGKWIWWPTANKDVTDEDGNRTSYHAYAVVMQEWHCVKDSWIKVTDTALGYDYGNFTTAPDVLPSKVESGSSLINYILKYVDGTADSRTGSTEDTKYSKECYVNQSSKVNCESSHSKVNETWDGNPAITSSTAWEQSTANTLESVLIGSSGIIDTRHTKYMKIGVGVYEFDFENNERNSNYLTYSDTGVLKKDVLAHSREFKIIDYETKRETVQTWSYGDNGKLEAFDFVFADVEPENRIEGNSGLKFHPNPAVPPGSPNGSQPRLIPSELRAGTLEDEDILLGWDEAGNLTTQFNDALWERYARIEATLASYGGTKYWLSPRIPVQPTP